MIRHIVLVRFKPEITRIERNGLFAELSALQAMIPGIHAFGAGPNISPETPVTHGFDDGFWFDFETEAVRDAYLANDAHRAIGARLVANALGGLTGIQVFDLRL